jgi:hypothetical protein
MQSSEFSEHARPVVCGPRGLIVSLSLTFASAGEAAFLT